MFDTYDEKWVFRHPDGREVQILRSGVDLEWDGDEDRACSGFRAESTVIPDLEEQGYVLQVHEGAPDDTAEQAAAIVASMGLPPGTDPVQPYAAAICDTLTQAGVGVEGYVLGAPELPAHRSPALGAVPHLAHPQPVPGQHADARLAAATAPSLARYRGRYRRGIRQLPPVIGSVAERQRWCRSPASA